tara:strand:+ start:413 stop:616 length:204 start_codon:yes stop_codon:yes gene_type:complete
MSISKIGKNSSNYKNTFVEKARVETLVLNNDGEYDVVETGVKNLEDVVKDLIDKLNEVIEKVNSLDS